MDVQNAVIPHMSSSHFRWMLPLLFSGFVWVQVKELDVFVQKPCLHNQEVIAITHDSLCNILVLSGFEMIMIYEWLWSTLILEILLVNYFEA